jgi:hypothetical protein
VKVISLREIPDPSRYRGFDAGLATQLCKNASAKNSQQGLSGYGEELSRRSKRSCKNEVVSTMKKKHHLKHFGVGGRIILKSTFVNKV